MLTISATHSLVFFGYLLFHQPQVPTTKQAQYIVEPSFNQCPLFKVSWGNTKHIKGTNWHVTSQLGFPIIFHCLCLRMSPKTYNVKRQFLKLQQSAFRNVFTQCQLTKFGTELSRIKLRHWWDRGFQVAVYTFKYHATLECNQPQHIPSHTKRSGGFQLYWRKATRHSNSMHVSVQEQTFICLNTVWPELQILVYSSSWAGCTYMLSTSFNCQCIQFLFDSDFL